MERVTFRRKDVQDLLGSMVCVKIDAGGRPHPLAERFNVTGFPTLVLMDPSGKIVGRVAGAPTGPGFTTYFASEHYNAGIDAYSRKDYAGCAPHFWFVRKWFPNTRLGKEVERLANYLRTNEVYVAAYAKVGADYKARLGYARKVLKKEEDAKREAQRKAREKREAAQKLKTEADTLYKKYLRTKAFKIYRKIIKDYPDTPEANDAREILRKHKKKW